MSNVMAHPGGYRQNHFVGLRQACQIVQERSCLIRSLVPRPSGGIILRVEQSQYRGDQSVFGGVRVELGRAFRRLEEPHLVVGGVTQDDVIEALIVEVVMTRHATQVDADIVGSRLHSKICKHSRCPAKYIFFQR